METKTIGRGVRFVNFLLDLVIFAVIASTIIYIVKTQTNLLDESNKLTDRIFSISLYIIYYLFFELIFKSTPGKFITKTKVVNEENKVPSGSAILIRSLVRIIPLEPISIFFYSDKQCWHDRFSNTKIIRIIH